MPQDPPRTRLMTRPPVPPRDIHEELRDLQHEHGALERGLEELSGKVTRMVDSLEDIQRTLLVASTERTAAEKRKDHFMKWVVGVSVAVTVSALGMLAGWVIHLQTALGR